jgi:hypothetical protein
MEEHIKLGEGGGGGRCYHHRHLHHHNHHSLDWKGERALDWIGLDYLAGQLLLLYALE